MASVAALVVGLMALAIAPGLAFYFDVTPKAVLLLIGTAVLLIAAARRPVLPRPPRLFTALLLFNAVSLAVSTVWSTHRSLSLYGSSWRSFGVLTECAAMLFAWLVSRQPASKAILWSVALSALLAGGFGVFHPPGTLGDSRSLMVWLLMSAFLTMVLVKTEQSPAGRGAALLAAVSIAILTVLAARAPLTPRPNQLLWRDTLGMAALRPVIGYGPEVFLADFPQFESKALARVNSDAIYESPRNAFLDVLVAQGAVGLLLLCGLWGAGLAAAWQKKDLWMGAALAAGIGCLQLTAFTLPTAVLAFTAVGLAVGRAAEAEAMRPARVLSFGAPFAVVALLFLALRLAMADHELVLTRRLLGTRDYKATTSEYESYWFWRLPGASADVWYSRSWLDVARASADPDVRTQALTIAEEASLRAVDDDEEPFLARFNLAQVAILEGDFDNAEHNLRRAISSHPNWYLPHRLLADELRRQGRTDEAQQEVSAAAELEGNRP